MRARSFGALGRRHIAVVTAAVLVLAGVAVLRSQSSAGADTKDTPVVYNCPIVGALTVTQTATDTPDPATAGGTMALSFQGGVPTVPITVTLNSVILELPIPAQVASVDNVSFSGGNVPGTATIGTGSVTLTFAGPVQSTAISLPATTLDVTLGAGTAGQTINWSAPTRISTDVQGIGLQACDGATTNPPMQTTQVQAAATTTTTTAPTTTTTRPTTTTTRPTTTTTQATTTTTRPTTTTTQATTTTTRLTTTTTRPTTTTTRPSTTTTQPSGGIIAFLKWLLCVLFHLC